MSKINFTLEHTARLKELAGEALLAGTLFKGNIGTEQTIYDLFHTCNVNTLTRYHGNIKKEVAEIEALDEWSLTDYQQKKAVRLKKNQELINLLIGYKRNQEQLATDREKVKALRAQYQTLKEATTTPEEKLKAIEAELAAYGPEVVE